MKILLFGKDGQVGRELQRTLLPFGDVAAVNRADIDLSDLAALEQLLQKADPDLIVNAAAYTAVDKAESDAETAFRINADAVEVMARHALARNTLLVHYSTDYVFDGEKPAAFTETDATHPLGIYGLSKRKGEAAILNSGCKALVFRTSWVFSALGSNFIKTILRLAKEKNRLDIVADQFGAPTSAELIADVTALAIAGFRFGKLDGGLYHLTAAGETSWHGFARHIVERALANGAELALDASRISAIPTEAYPVAARRPKNSRLDTGLLCTRLGLELPDWRLHADRTIDRLTQTQ